MISSSTLFIILIVVSVLLFGYTVYMHIKLRAFLLGTNGSSLEPILHEDRKRVEVVLEENKTIRTRLDTAEKKLRQAVRAVDTIRFNPFPDQGSNQSFASALIDEEGNGVVFSSLYGRDRVSIFAKPVSGGTSSFELTSEEKDVIKNSQTKQYGK